MTSICNRLITEYLLLVTVCWFDDHDLPADQPEEYDGLIEQIRIAAAAREETDLLQLAFAAALADPAINAADYAGGRYPFDDAEVRAIIARAYRRLWPDAPFPPPQPEGVVLYDLPFAEWQRTRRYPQPTDPPI